jgi:putative PIN family toxin of toxin-antitoxin system
MPARKRTRVVVDVNVLVAALISADQAFVQLLFNKQRLTVLVSDTLFEEFERVTARSRLRKYFTSVEAARALRRIHGLSEHVDADPPFAKVCRDEKDDYLLALARTGKADLLITGDEDLLVLKKYGKARIVKPAAFRKEFL